MADSNFTPVVQPCIKCGAMDRYSSGKCAPCSKARCKDYSKANKERLNAVAAAYRAEHKFEVAKWLAEYYVRNAGRLKKYARDRVEKDRVGINASRVANRAANATSRRATSKAWRDANKEHLRNYAQKGRMEGRWKSDKERAKKTSAIWAKKNRIHLRAKGHNRRALIKSIGGKITKPEIANLLLLQRCLCPTCRISLKHGYHIDHINPISVSARRSHVDHGGLPVVGVNRN